MTTNGVAHPTDSNAFGPPQAAASPVAVPVALQPKLRALVAAHSAAKAELGGFVDAIFLVLALPAGSDWTIDTESMTLRPRVADPLGIPGSKPDANPK